MEMETLDPTNEITVAITEEAEHVSSLFTAAGDFIRGILPSLGFAAAVFLGGMLITKLVLKFVGRALRKSRIEPTAASFLHSLLTVIMYVLVMIIVLSVLNVPMTSIITVIGTMGLAIGLALQDSLSNVAGGFLILFSKPLKVGDYVEFDGITGTVESIAILQTKLRCPDGTTVFIPNSKISEAVICNYSEDPKRRLDINFGIAYEADFEEAKSIISDILDKSPYVLKDMPPIVRVGSLDDSAVTIHVRVWTLHENYWSLHYDLHEQVKHAFDEKGIGIPFPQMDVHVAKS